MHDHYHTARCGRWTRLARTRRYACVFIYVCMYVCGSISLLLASCHTIRGSTDHEKAARPNPTLAPQPTKSTNNPIHTYTTHTPKPPPSITNYPTDPSPKSTHPSHHLHIQIQSINQRPRPPTLPPPITPHNNRTKPKQVIEELSEKVARDDVRATLEVQKQTPTPVRASFLDRGRGLHV